MLYRSSSYRLRVAQCTLTYISTAKATKHCVNAEMSVSVPVRSQVGRTGDRKREVEFFFKTHLGTHVPMIRREHRIEAHVDYVAGSVGVKWCLDWVRDYCRSQICGSLYCSRCMRHSGPEDTRRVRQEHIDGYASYLVPLKRPQW